MVFLSNPLPVFYLRLIDSVCIFERVRRPQAQRLLQSIRNPKWVSHLEIDKVRGFREQQTSCLTVRVYIDLSNHINGLLFQFS